MGITVVREVTDRGLTLLDEGRRDRLAEMNLAYRFWEEKLPTVARLWEERME